MMQRKNLNSYKYVQTQLELLKEKEMQTKLNSNIKAELWVLEISNKKMNRTR
jgi:hypothetical protein